MQSEITESVQQSIRPGEMKDLYYAGETNTEKSAYASVVNTRFVQQFTNLGAGSSQFVISPNGGVSDIICAFTMPTLGSTTGLALPTGWGYNLINRISVRYGSSAQYFWSGSQVLVQNVHECENNTKADQVVAIGGNYATGAGVNGAKGYVYLKLPHNSIRAQGKPLPFPTDLLVQPIVVTVELLSPSAVFVPWGATPAIGSLPTALASAQLQVKQEMLTDSSDLLSRRVDMNQNAYTFPLPYFCQQQVQVPLNLSVTQSVNLTGFRAGEVKSIVLWLTGSQTSAPSGGGAYPQLNVFYPITALTLTYNGEIFSRFDDGSSQLWNISANEKASYFTGGVISTGTAGTGANTPTTMPWVECPFSQVSMPTDRENLLCHGKPILNAVVQVTFSVPDNTNTYTLNAMYLYNSSLLCSRGSSEYIF